MEVNQPTTSYIAESVPMVGITSGIPVSTSGLRGPTAESLIDIQVANASVIEGADASTPEEQYIWEPYGDRPLSETSEEPPDWRCSTIVSYSASEWGSPTGFNYSVNTATQPKAVVPTVYTGPVDSYTSHLLLACCVFWLCNLACGGIAMFLACKFTVVSYL